MARPAGDEVQLVEYPYFDTAWCGTGISAVTSPINLYGRVGRPEFSNMQQASVIASGGVFLISSLRCSTYFKSLANTEYTVAYGNITAEASYTSSAARMMALHEFIGYAVMVTLFINQVPQIVLPWWQFPAGGGAYGSSLVWGQFVMSNGMPSRESICRFLQPVEVASLQTFTVQCQFNVFGRRSIAGDFTGTAQGGAITNDFNVLQQLNEADGLKYGLCTAGGHVSRDIGG